MATVDGRGDRAQLILVAAVGLAVTFVALALILNSAIFTSNLASRNIESGASDALEAHNAARDGVGGLMDSVNNPDTATDYGGLDTNYNDSLEEWAEEPATYGALRGASVNVSAAGKPTNGTRIVDRNTTSKFTPRGDTPPDWTVAPNVRARNFELVVTDVSVSPSDSDVGDELDDSTWTDGSFFYVDIDDGEWRMAIYGDGSGNVKVAVYDDDSGAFTVCSSTPASTPVHVDVGAGLVNGEPCEALRSVSKQTGPYTIHFSNGEQAEGTYDLTVDRAVADPSSANTNGSLTDVVDRLNYGQHCNGPTYFRFNTVGDYPFVAPALYSGDVNMDYRSKSIEYHSSFRVAADELSEGATAPKVMKFNVTADNSDSTVPQVEFVIDWAVADPDGNLDSLEIEVEDDSGTVIGTATPPVSGQRWASGSTTISSGVAISNPQTITVTVDDGTTSRTVVQEHEADGDMEDCLP